MATTALEIILRARDDASKVVSQAGHNMSSSMKSMGATVARAGAASAAAIGVAAVAAGTFAIKSATDFEKMNVALKTAFQGNEQAARDASRQITAFAAKTPYELQEVMTSFIKLKNMGLDPSREALTAYGDTASAMGKSLNEMVEAVADAATGEFERLKEFGIRSSVEGDKVKFTFQGVTTTVGKNAAEIERYLINLGKTKFAGGMEAQSKTLSGMVSTLRDSLSLAAAEFAEKSGLFDLAKNAVAGLTGAVDSLSTFLNDGVRIAQMFFHALRGVDPTLRPGEERLIGVAKVLAGLYDTFLAVREGVSQFAAVAQRTLLPPLQDLWKTIGTELVPALKELWTAASPILIPALKALATLIGVTLLVSLRVSIAVWTALVKTLTFTARAYTATINAIVAAIDWLAALPGLVTRFFTDIHNAIVETMTAAATTAITTTQNFVNGMVSWFQQLPGRVYRYVADLFTNKIPYAIGYAIGFASVMVPKLINDTVAWFQQLPGRIQAYLTQMVHNIQTSMMQAWNSAIIWSQRTIDGVIGWFTQLPGRIAGIFVGTAHAASTGMQNTANAAASGAANTVNSVTGWLSALPGRVTGAIAAIPGIVGGVFQAAAHAAMGALGRLWDGVQWIWNQISAVVDKIVGAFNRGTQAGKALKVPGFANGTNFAPGGLAIVGERGPELVNLPRGSQVIPNHKLSTAGVTINGLTINNYTPTDQRAMFAELGWTITRLT